MLSGLLVLFRSFFFPLLFPACCGKTKKQTLGNIKKLNKDNFEWHLILYRLNIIPLRNVVSKISLKTIFHTVMLLMSLKTIFHIVMLLIQYQSLKLISIL